LLEAMACVLLCALTIMTVEITTDTAGRVFDSRILCCLPEFAINLEMSYDARETLVYYSCSFTQPLYSFDNYHAIFWGNLMVCIYCPFVPSPHASVTYMATCFHLKL
jgi:hypothetical protein